MRILITGATGLIGTQLTEYCIDDGIKVNYLTTSREKIENRPNYKGFYWNPENGEIDIEAFTDVTAIINLVGATISKRWTNSYKKTILESRTKTANLLFNTLKGMDHTISQFISASGVSVYPDHPTKLYDEENEEVSNTFLGEVVVAWEAAADQFETLGMRVAKIRTGVVFSEKEGAFQKIKEPIEKGFGAPLGSGEQWISWVHLQDIASLYIHVLKSGLEGVYNAVAPNPVTNKNLTFKIASTLGKNIWLPNVPGWVLKIMLGEMATLVLESQLVSSKKIEDTGYSFMFVNVNYAVKKLM
ncbi:TIGR01777 family oxidoreductase [Rasiella sp. SM2506]|uniref:TIGR01777 family oxidoreductase n=1 Tax=Rasiella sp. SM2506 TaxID=3423914 RepID=UPI003D7A8991